MPYKNPKDPKLVARRARLRAKAYRDNPLRQCSKCKLVMRVVAEDGSKNFTAHSVAADGLRPYCRLCERTYCSRKRLRKKLVRVERARIRRAPLKVPGPFWHFRRKFWSFRMVMRYLGIRGTSVIRRLCGLQFSQVIPPQLRMPTPLLKGSWGGRKGVGRLWTKEAILRWERDVFRPNAAIFFAYVREWEKTENRLALRKERWREWCEYRHGSPNRRASNERRHLANVLRGVARKPIAPPTGL